MNIWWWSPQIQRWSPQIYYTEITHDWALLWISALTKLTGWSKWLMWSMDSVNNTNQNWYVFVQIAKNYYNLQYVFVKSAKCICTKLTGWSKWLMWSVSTLVRSLTQLKSEMYLSTIWFCKMYLSKVQTVFVQNWLMWSMGWVNNSTQKWPSHLTACVTSQWCLFTNSWCCQCPPSLPHPPLIVILNIDWGSTTWLVRCVPSDSINDAGGAAD